MKHQLAFLLCLGAYENRNMSADKVGFTSDMRAYPDNEKLWLEAKQPIPLSNAIYAAIDELGPEYLDVAVAGTLFPAEDEQYKPRWREIIRSAGKEIDLKIGFDGRSFEDADSIRSGKERLAEKLIKGEVPVDYTSHAMGERHCLLTDRQVRMLAVMGLQFEGC